VSELLKKKKLKGNGQRRRSESVNKAEMR